jgi:ABC-type glycerol-3-phosphate transport system substrate-binding protein
MDPNQTCVSRRVSIDVDASMASAPTDRNRGGERCEDCSGLDPIPLPAEAQSYFLYVAGISSGSTQADAAKALIAFLTSSAVKQAWTAGGFEPR